MKLIYLKNPRNDSMNWNLSVVVFRLLPLTQCYRIGIVLNLKPIISNCLGVKIKNSARFLFTNQN